MNDERIANYSGRERCPYCDDEGQIAAFAETRPRYVRRSGRRGTATVVDGTITVAVQAPCPKCERGFRFEFGHGLDKDGNEYIARGGGPCGRDGFWQGRPSVELEPLPDSAPASEQVVREYLEQIRLRSL